MNKPTDWHWHSSEIRHWVSNLIDFIWQLWDAFWVQSRLRRSASWIINSWDGKIVVPVGLPLVLACLSSQTAHNQFTTCIYWEVVRYHDEGRQVRVFCNHMKKEILFPCFRQQNNIWGVLQYSTGTYILYITELVSQCESVGLHVFVKETDRRLRYN